MTVYLRGLAPKPDAEWASGYPFEVPLIRALDEVRFTAPVTFLVGENGCGKSTLLEAIAAGIESVTVAGDDASADPSLESIRELARLWRFTWNKRTRRGFFLRAEDFFSFAQRVGRMSEELEEEAQRFEDEVPTLGGARAADSIRRQREEMIERYGVDLHAHSHGESFLKLFEARFVPGGLYLLDEPEAPLSPLRQLSFLAMVKEMVDRDAQFVIATHSPILMALPGATLLSCDEGQVREVAYDDLEHVRLTRDFLKDPSRFLRHL